MATDTKINPLMMDGMERVQELKSARDARLDAGPPWDEKPGAIEAYRDLVTRAAVDADAMTLEHPRWSDFTERLDHGLTETPCKAGTDKTVATGILESMGLTSDRLRLSLAYFEENGGFCDCEILANVEPGDFESNGRMLFFEGDDPTEFLAELKRLGIEPSISFDCPAGLLDHFDNDRFGPFGT
jgi:hypothetical protein